MPSVALPPVISANCRSADDVASELQHQLQQHPQALVKDVEPDMYSSLRKVASTMELKVQYQARAKMLVVKPLDAVLPGRQRLPGIVFVVSAGPEDQMAVDQVMVAAEHMGCYVISKPNFSTREMARLMEQAEGATLEDQDRNTDKPKLQHITACLLAMIVRQSVLKHQMHVAHHACAALCV